MVYQQIDHALHSFVNDLRVTKERETILSCERFRAFTSRFYDDFTLVAKTKF